MSRPVTAPERTRMRADRRNGMPERAIAAKYRRALTTVQRHVGDLPSSALDVDRPGRLSRAARATLARAIATQPAASVAWRFGVSASAARAIAGARHVAD